MSLLKRKPDNAVPTFSLCHTTARLPDGWKPSAQAWFDKCDHPETVEHIIATDDPFSPKVLPFADTKLVLNKGRRCAVDGWNTAAAHSTGKFLITVADDWFPCEHWDTELLKQIPDLDGEYVLEVDTGGNPGLLTFSMLTRKYYKRYGYIFYPEFLGMYGDNWFTDVARRDGVVIDARDLFFEHRHPLYGHGEMDATHKHQHRPEAFKVGEEVYMRLRKVHGFDKEYIPPRQFLIAVCLPGESFRHEWVANWTQLASYLKDNANVAPMFGYAPNPHITRAMMAKQILEMQPFPDFVLWIDHDNTVAPLHFAQLFESLQAHPDVDGVTGWCWWGDPPRISAGVFDGNQRRPLTQAELMGGNRDTKAIDWTGFPCFLMRGEALKKIGPRPFLPIVSDEYPWGFAPEDIAFSVRAKDRGLKFLIDRRVEVEHRKLAPLQPEKQEHVA